jgi:hypothetical protein
MSRDALKVSTVHPEVQVRREAGRAERADQISRSSSKAQHKALFSGKKFKNLNASQKDKLLRAVAVELGFLDSDDVED